MPDGIKNAGDRSRPASTRAARCGRAAGSLACGWQKVGSAGGQVLSCATSAGLRAQATEVRSSGSRRLGSRAGSPSAIVLI